MNYKVILYLLTIMTPYLYGDAIISLYLKPYPHSFTEEEALIKEKKLAKPGHIARQQYRQLTTPLSLVRGIIALYGGYITTSDYEGHIMLPLQQETPTLSLAITTKVTPIMIAQNTIHHWELEEGTPSDFYEITRQEDPLTHTWYTNITRAAIPTNLHVSPFTLILMARPQDIYVPEGASLTEKSPHFLVPDIYVKKIQSVTIPLYMLQLNQYFGSLNWQYRALPRHYLQQMKK